MVSLGGAHQYFSYGKLIGYNAFLNETWLSNGRVALELDTLFKDVVDLQLDAAIDKQLWHGAVVQQLHNFSYLDTALYASGDEWGIHAHGALEKKLGSLTAGADLLFSGMLYGDNVDGAIDAGVSLLWEREHLQVGLYGGRMTSRPDIRGLPNATLRREKFPTYIIALPVKFSSNSLFSVNVQPYLRKKMREVQMDPLLFAWDPEQTTPVLATGADGEGRWQVASWIELSSSVNLSWAQRLVGGEEEEEEGRMYEWNIPWTMRNGIHAQFGGGYHCYLTTICAHGMPYFDAPAGAYTYLPTYEKLDLSLQYRNTKIKHRYITRYDGYVNVTNVQQLYKPLFNVRDFYWIDTMQRRGVSLSVFVFELGVRFGFRL